MKHRSSRPRNTNRLFQLQYHPLESRQLLAGNLELSFRGDALAIVGDDQANQIELVTNDAGQVTIRGLGTTINGSSNPVVLSTAIKRFSMRLNGGDDRCTIDGLTVAQQFQWFGGRGDDFLQMKSVNAKSCTIDLGEGNNTLEVDGVQTRRQTDIKSKGGSNVVALHDLTTGRNTRVRLGSGHDTVSTQNVQVGRQLQIDLGKGNNSATLAGGTVGGSLQVRAGGGQDALAIAPERLGTSLVVNRSLRVDLGSGDDKLSMDAQLTAGKSSRVQGGKGTNSLYQATSATQPTIVAKQWNSAPRSLENQTVHKVVDDLRARNVNAVPFGGIELTMNPQVQLVDVPDPSPTVSALWDRAAQAAVIAERSGPTISSRAYGMVHTAIYDAWSAYDAAAISSHGTDQLQRPSQENTEANKRMAMSFAAFRVLTDLFPSRTAIFTAVMDQLGYDESNAAVDQTPAGIGNQMAAALLAARHADGSNQLGTDPNGTAGVRYSDNSGYVPVNQASNQVNIERWTPERVPIDAVPGEEIRTQSYLTPHWGNVEMFGLDSSAAFRPAAPEPFLMVNGTVNLVDKTITVNGEVLNISKDLIGTVINPAFIEQAEEVIEISGDLTDEQKLIAEFWEDGGGTSFPPGTWMTFGRYVSARDNHTTDEDAKMFLGLGNAVLNAGIATWEAKRFYDYARPVRAIRELGRLGLVGEFDAQRNGYVIDAWVQGQGTQSILAEDFLTYQTPGADPSPPFAEHTSGHSAFSAAAAAVLREFTGSDDFGAFVTFQPGQSRFEAGLVPSAPLQLSWTTFTAAATEAGMSRLYGGIHFMNGNLDGSQLGTEVGQATWDYAERLIAGTLS